MLSVSSEHMLFSFSFETFGLGDTTIKLKFDLDLKLV